ncbi:TIGR00270 family protein [Candidatus Woesearchaeota archaeon]|nr:TIGR00270 family protein [Candidatus Woesearchaeota archaeon]
MVNCELCGSESVLFSAFVEGIKLRVCSNCKKFGKVIEEPIVKKHERIINIKNEVVDCITDDFSVIVKNSRESRGLSQHDLANSINEKESLLSKIEQGSIKPSIKLARKLERFLGLKLVVKEKIAEAPITKVNNSALTIGDFVRK